MAKPPDTSTILIISGTPDGLVAVVNLLEGRNYQVAIAQDGEEGVKQAVLCLPDLILLDVMLPGADGFEICRRLKAGQRTCDIPVMFLMASATPDSKRKGFEAGGDDYFTVPLQDEEVIARVGTHLKLGAIQRQLATQTLELAKHCLVQRQLVAERTQVLTESERRFRTLAENLPDCIVRYDRMCRATYFNPALARSLGQRFQPRLGMTPDEALPGIESMRAYRRLLEHVMASGDDGEMELASQAPDGTPQTLQVRMVAEHDTQGTIVGGLVIGRDITQRKRLQQQLKLKEFALDQVREAVYLEDGNARFLYVNHEACRSLGYTREELLGMTVSDVDPDVSPDAWQQIAQSSRERGVCAIEGRHQTKDGRIFPIEGSCSYFEYLGKGYHFALVHDATERKQAESALKESERRYREIFENSSDALYLAAVSPQGRFRNLEFNAAFEKSTGIPRELLIHDPAAGREEFVNRVDGFVNVDTVRAVIEKLRRCLNAGAVIEEEFAFDLPVGRRYYHASLVPLRDTSGRIYRILCIVRDISERQRMALRLEESRLLLRQLAARNEEAREDERRRLKREIHDELGQYLSALRLGISVVDIQLGKKRSPLRANTSRLIGVIDTTIKVVRDVVVALRPSALDMGIVSALEWLVAEYFDHTGISCELHIPDDDLDMDDKRATAVFRISQESLTNIARHAQATQVAISLEEMEGSYRLEVRDNGQGFDPSVRKEESFGLVGIQERALMLGGKVGISSVPGKTTIRVQFPVGSEG